MTEDDVEKAAKELERAGAFQLPTLDDNPETVRQAFAATHPLDQWLADLRVTANRLISETELELIDLKPCWCAKAPCHDTQGKALRSRLARLENARRIGEIRFHQIRTWQKNMRSLARMIENTYSATTSDVWLQRPPRKRKG